MRRTYNIGQLSDSTGRSSQLFLNNKINTYYEAKIEISVCPLLIHGLLNGKWMDVSFSRVH